MLLAMITVKRLYEIRVDIDDSLPVDDVFPLYSAIFWVTSKFFPVR
jgi:hypothetical protein